MEDKPGGNAPEGSRRILVAEDSKATAESMAKLTWKQTAERLKGLVLQHGLGSFITHP